MGFFQKYQTSRIKKKKKAFLCLHLGRPFFHVELHILTKIILFLTQDKITMMLWNWRAHSISTVLITRSQTAPALLGFIAQITTEHKGTQALPRELTGKDCVSI